MFQAKGLAISFGALDPSNAVTMTVPVAAATLYANRAGDCANGMNMVISADNGQNFNGSPRMRRSTSNDFIAYSLGLPTAARPGPGNGTYVPFSFSGTVAGAAYQDAPEGEYADTVVITVSP